MLTDERPGARILVVEDEPELASLLALWLERHGWLPSVVHDGPHALAAFEHEEPDIVLLDLSLPNLDGWGVIERLRRVSPVPILIVTARDAEQDKIRGLGAGADDYVTKPFSSAHLAARIAAVLRRGRTVRPGGSGSPPIQIGGLRIDPDRRAAELDGCPLQLTRREFDLLAYLAARSGRVVTRREIVTEVWQQPHAGNDQTLDVHISWLRRKLGETAATPRFIHTVRGVGLMLVPPE